MTESDMRAGSPEGDPARSEGPPSGFVFRDKRRIDPRAGQPDGAAQAPGAKEATMTDNPQDRPAGDEPIGEDVFDDDVYRGRHTREGEGSDGDIAGVPSGWPTAEGDLPPTGPPTSPTSGAASEAAARAAYESAPTGTQPSPRTAPEADVPPVEEAPVEAAEPGADADANAILAAERLADLQRLQAEYVNYKRRVDRDREVEKQRTIGSVIESMLPVLDEIHLARQHGELESGPFAKIAEKLEGVLAKHGVERYGQPGEAFDPMVHEAIMHTEAELAPGTTETTVVQVMQPGYRIGDRVVRAALVAVADPQ